MNEIKKTELTKDLTTIISETNILILDLNEHLEVLFQNINDLNNDFYSKKFQTFHLKILLKELISKIDRLKYP